MEQVIFLEKRDVTHTGACLVSANLDGYVRFWTTTHSGGKIGEFFAAHRCEYRVERSQCQLDYPAHNS